LSFDANSVVMALDQQNYIIHVCTPALANYA